MKPTSAPCPDGRTILTVDEDPEFVSLVEETAASMGDAAAAVPNLRSARFALDRVAFDVVIVEAALSDGSGLDLAAWLRCSKPHVRVIVTAEHLSVAIAIRAYRNGAAEFLAKPITRDSLRKALEAVRP